MLASLWRTPTCVFVFHRFLLFSLSHTHETHLVRKIAWPGRWVGSVRTEGPKTRVPTHPLRQISVLWKECHVLMEKSYSATLGRITRQDLSASVVGPARSDSIRFGRRSGFDLVRLTWSGTMVVARRFVYGFRFRPQFPVYDSDSLCSVPGPFRDWPLQVRFPVPVSCSRFQLHKKRVRKGRSGGEERG